MPRVRKYKGIMLSNNSIEKVKIRWHKTDSLKEHFLGLADSAWYGLFVNGKQVFHASKTGNNWFLYSGEDFTPKNVILKGGTLRSLKKAANGLLHLATSR